MPTRLRYTFKQQASGDLEIYLYSDISAGYEDWWGDKRGDECSADKLRQLLDGAPNAQNINLYINSYGGDVKEGYGIYAMLKRHPAHKKCYVDGIAASIASVIAIAADEIIMYRNSVMVIHNMECGIYGNAVELRKAADDLDKMMEGNRQIYLARSAGKLTEEQLAEMLDAETTLTAIEAQGYGLCDTIVDAAPPAPPEEIGQAIKQMWQAWQPKDAPKDALRDPDPQKGFALWNKKGGLINEKF